MAVEYEVGESYYSRLLDEWFRIVGIRESWYNGDYEYIVEVYTKNGLLIHKTYYDDSELDVLMKG